MNGRWVLLLAGSLWLTGCGFDSGGPLQHDSQAIDRDNSELVRVNLDLGAGTMRVAGGADKLVAADFHYGAAASRPDVHYSSAAGHGSLTISQPGNSSTLSHTTKEWDLRLNNEAPMELEIHFGGGEAHLNLGALTLRSLDVQMGAGELDLDLRGTPKKSYEARVHCGAGETTIHLPSTVGVEAQAKVGIGEFEAPGLHKEGNRYFNDAFGKSNVTIHLDVEGGAGSLRLISN